MNLESHVAVLKGRRLYNFNGTLLCHGSLGFKMTGHISVHEFVFWCVCMCVWCGCWTVHPSVHSRLLTVILIPLQISKYWPSISLPIPLSGFIFHSCFLITTAPSLSRTECMGGKWVLSQWKNTAVPNSHIHIGTHSCTRNPTFLSNHLFSQQASALNDRSFARVLQASGEVCSCP